MVESFSIDEVFLDMTGTSLIYPDPIATAHQIKDKIHEELGFTVNVGISTNKLLAKMASDFEKPDKVHTLFPAEIPEKMWPLPIRDLLFLGKASEKKLQDFGIHTIGELAREKESTIQALLGEKTGRQLYQYARGIDNSRCLPRQKRARASAWRKPSMTTLFPWNRCFPFFWSSATLLLPACGGKGRNAAVFPSPSVPWTSRTVPIRPAFPVPRT